MSKLTVKLPGHPPVTHDLGNGAVLVGRSTECDLQILHGLVSKRHAMIERRGAEHHVRDLDSHNGTFVNNQRVRDALLKQGDTIRFAVVDCVFEFSPEEAVLPAKAAAPRAAAPAQSISTKDLPAATPEDLEPLEAIPSAAAPKPVTPVAEETVLAKAATPPTASPFSAAPPTSRRTPLPRPTADTLAALKYPPPPAPAPTSPAQPASAPAAFQPRPIPRRREPMPTWLFLTLGIGMAACAAAGVWFFLNPPAGDAPPEIVAGAEQQSIPAARPSGPAGGSESPSVTTGTGTASPADPVATDDAPLETAMPKPTISAVDAPAIGAMLRDPSVNIRRSAARALHALGLDAAGAAKDLQDALKDEDSEARIWAALALTQLDTTDQATVPVLIQGLKHQSPEVREASALSMGMIQFQGDESAPVLELLIRLSVEDPDAAVRRAASSATKLLNAKTALKRDA